MVKERKKEMRECDKGEVATGRHASKTIMAGHLLREHRSPVLLPVESRRPAATFEQGRQDRLLMRGEQYRRVP
jgi:hypothetical protein